MPAGGLPQALAERMSRELGAEPVLPLRAELATAQRTARAAYRERAHLVAFLSSLYPSVLCANDPDAEGYPVLYVDTIAGQMTWHIHPDDLLLFKHVRWVEPDYPHAQWDGHTTDQKYQRLDRLRDLLTERPERLR